jgi:ring-1,2-phenylacetyl-CoA epoxidase subunit PaaC
MAVTTMQSDINLALIAKLTALADDELLLCQRNGEWIGHAPMLEEDIALANIAQDELGHAMLWLGLRQELDNSDPDRSDPDRSDPDRSDPDRSDPDRSDPDRSDPDRLCFGREAADFRSCQLVEQPKGDWAFTLLRQYLFDAYEQQWLAAACHSSHQGLAAIAHSIGREERFHLEYSSLWVKQLALGTAESQQRSQQALNILWPLAGQLFVPLPGDDLLLKAAIIPATSSIQARWQAEVGAYLHHLGLVVPSTPMLQAPRHIASPYRAALIAELQAVARSDAATAVW